MNYNPTPFVLFFLMYSLPLFVRDTEKKRTIKFSYRRLQILLYIKSKYLVMAEVGFKDHRTCKGIVTQINMYVMTMN